MARKTPVIACETKAKDLAVAFAVAGAVLVRLGGRPLRLAPGAWAGQLGQTRHGLR
jgi:hypothetical protein